MGFSIFGPVNSEISKYQHTNFEAMIGKIVIKPKTSVRYQCLAALVVSMISTGYGIICGWASPTINLLTSDETPLKSGKMTMEEASWIAALIAVGSLLGNMCYGLAMRTFGRKKSLISMSVPMIISWLLVLFAPNYYYLYAARVLQGMVSGGVLVVAPVYLLEISSDRIRGITSTTVLMSAHGGIVIAFILATFCDFYTIPIFQIVSAVLFVIAFSFFPESPVFLMKQNKIAEAEKALRFYQNILKEDQNCEIPRVEVKDQKTTVDGGDKTNQKISSSKGSEFLTKPARKAMTIGFVVCALNQFSGCVAMVSYTANIFKEAGSALSPNMSSIVVATIQFVGTIAMVVLVERMGRKVLYIISTIGTASGLLMLGVYMMLKSWGYNIEAFSWVPIVALSVALFTAALAILTLPFTVIGEILPEDIKDYGITILNCFISISAFLAMKLLPDLLETLGFHNSMFVFAGVCLSSALFISLCMPEIKGKNYNEIQQSLQ